MSSCLADKSQTLLLSQIFELHQTTFDLKYENSQKKKRKENLKYEKINISWVRGQKGPIYPLLI